MLSFFRINDPYRLIFIFFLLLIFRLPFIIGGIELTLMELNDMILGESLQGSRMLYRDVWEATAPLSGFMFWSIDLLFGRSQLAYQVIGLFVVFVQAAIFNRLLLNNKAFNENSYVPALIYIICSCASPYFYSLSAPMVSVTFILLAINNIFKRIDNLTRDELFLNTGIYLGLASLFYFPSIVFLFSTLLSLILFSSAIPRRLGLLVFGFGLLISLLGCYYFWHDSLREFLFQYMLSAFNLPRQHYLEYVDLFLISLVPGLFFIISFFKLYSRSYYVNFQVKFQSVFLITGLSALLGLILEPRLSPHSLTLFVPVFAFFISHLFLLIEKRKLAEVALLIFLLFTLSYPSVATRDIKWIGQLLNLESLSVKASPYENTLESKEILVLGNSLNHYTNATLATPYLNWELSQVHFDALEYYDILTEVYKHFEANPPQVIVDQNETAREILSKMPNLERRYIERGPLFIRVD